MPDSSTGGYLTPTNTTVAPLYDGDLDDLFQRVTVGITELADTLVRPRWQEVTPTMPERGVNWCAIGVTEIKSDDNPAMIHHPEGDGTTESVRHEYLTVIATFYGPNASGNASKFRDGMYLTQNRDELYANQIGLTYAGNIIGAHEFVNQLQVKRYDITLRFMRKVSRIYAIRNLAGVDMNVYTDLTGNTGANPVFIAPDYVNELDELVNFILPPIYNN